MMVDQGKFNKTRFYQSAQIDDLDGIIVDGDDEGIMTAAIESSRSPSQALYCKIRSNGRVAPPLRATRPIY